MPPPKLSKCILLLQETATAREVLRAPVITDFHLTQPGFLSTLPVHYPLSLPTSVYLASHPHGQVYLGFPLQPTLPTELLDPARAGV
jgi:hypothetical protein